MYDKLKSEVLSADEKTQSEHTTLLAFPVSCVLRCHAVAAVWPFPGANSRFDLHPAACAKHKSNAAFHHTKLPACDPAPQQRCDPCPLHHQSGRKRDFIHSRRLPVAQAVEENA